MTGQHRPNVIIIAPFSPWPSLSGGALRTARFAEAAAKIANVRMLSLYSQHSLQGPNDIEEIVVRPDSASLLWSLCDDTHPLAPRLPDVLGLRANRLIDEFDPDIIFFEQTVTTGLIESITSKTAKRVLNSHNFDSELLKEVLAEQKKGTLTTANQMRFDQALAQEISVARSCDSVICCSKLDAQKFKELAGICSPTVPNPLPDERAFDLAISTERYVDAVVLYVGSMDYAPNVNAAKSLLSVMPPILPDEAKLVFLGRKASNLEKHANGLPNVEIVSDPADLTPLLGAGGFSVMPIRQGGGTRLKVLEAMAAGLVVIATAKAVEGLELEPGQHYVQAETDDDFRQSYIKWSKSPDQCRAIATRARQFVKDNYSQESFNNNVAKAIAEVLRGQDPKVSRTSNPQSDRRVISPSSFQANSPTSPVAESATAITGPHEKFRQIKVKPFLVGTFHKTGTVLLLSILRDLGNRHGVAVWNCSRDQHPPLSWDVMFSEKSKFKHLGVDPTAYPTLIVIRDPRDVIISSAYYHMKSAETWLHEPEEKFNGRTYQEEINRLSDMRERFLFEMDHSAGATIRSMVALKNDPAFANARFVHLETLMTDFNLVAYREAFSFLGIATEDLPAVLDCAEQNSVFAGKRNKHIRDPRPAQWRELFDSDLHAQFGSRFCEATAILGYEG